MDIPIASYIPKEYWKVVFFEVEAYKTMDDIYIRL
jgi:hypothetical protein